MRWVFPLSSIAIAVVAMLAIGFSTEEAGVTTGGQSPPQELARERADDKLSGAQRITANVPCTQANMNPFASHSTCNPAEMSALQQDASDAEQSFAEIRRIVTEALAGDPAAMKAFPIQYFLQCLNRNNDLAAPAEGENRMVAEGGHPDVPGECRAESLKVNNDKFIQAAGILAEQGNTTAQFSLASLYLLIDGQARSSLNAAPAGVDAPPSENGSSIQIPPLGDSKPSSDELRKAAYYLRQAAEKEPAARDMLAVLESTGILPSSKEAE
jgi:hypothetical protein